MVVRHGDHDVELSRVASRVPRAHEHGVGRERPARRDAFGQRGSNRRRDDAHFLVAEQPALACMRIEAGDGDARMRDAEAAHGSVGDANRLEHGLERDRLDGSAQRHVDRHQHRAQLVVGQHHANRRSDAVPCGKGLQHLGVARVRDAGRSQRPLVDRRRDDGRDPAIHRQVHRLLDAASGGRTGARTHAADRGVDQARGDAGCLQHADAVGRQRRRIARLLDRGHGQHAAGERGGSSHHRDVTDHETAFSATAKQRRDDLRADAARVAHRDGDRQSGTVHLHAAIVAAPVAR